VLVSRDTPSPAPVYSSHAYRSCYGADVKAADGLTTVASRFGPKETLDRLEADVKAKGLTVFARIDHAAGAAAVGLSLLPTAVLIFGNARGGTPLMQSNQLIGIDLPLKVLVWQDTSGKTWLSYVDPGTLAQRYGLPADTAASVNTLSGALRALTTRAAGSD
jgi:uncharacterized protein (DUF302 family)